MSSATLELKTIHLSGELGRKFGRVHKFAIANPAEAIRALCANFKEFRQHLIDSEQRGVGYRVLAADKDTQLDDLHNPTGRAEIKILPVISGAKDGTTQFILGAALVVASFYMPPIALVGGATMASMAFGIGVSLALGGISQMLAPMPKTKDAPNNVASYAFSGPVNATAQGTPVPVGYGRLMVGSVVISAGITVDQIL
jgi:predicted phage tail protein